MKNEVIIYTDGSCRNKDGRAGGCGIVLLYKEHKREVSLGQFISTTSARMELYAAIEALKLIINKSIPIKLYSDNQYLVRSISERWIFKWEREDWYERKNADLLKQLLSEYRKFPAGNVEFIWCKGHTKDNEFNILADKLAGIGGKCENITIDKCL